MSVSSFIHFHGIHLVHFSFDPFHRLIRDMKLDVAGIGPKTLRQKLLQAQLCSSFVWSVNYRPYGSGAFATSKKEILEHFLSTEYKDPLLFFCVCARVARLLFGGSGVHSWEEHMWSNDGSFCFLSMRFLA